MWEAITECRICKNINLDDLIDLGLQAITSRFPAANEPDPPVMPLVVTKCTGQGCCGLVQMKYLVPAEEMYLQTYGYRSGLNESMVAHIKGILSYVLGFLGQDLGDGDIVLDIGSNDGTLLSFYPRDLQRVGIDPTASQFKQFYDSGIIVVDDFFTLSAFQDAIGHGAHAKCVTSISMFYDLPDPQAFVQDVADVLDPQCGIWVMEQSYMPAMLATNSFDTICHEHLEYYCLAQIQWMCERSKLRIVDVEFNQCNGGSFRVAICHEGARFTSNTAKVHGILDEEASAGLATEAPYREFQARCEGQKRRLKLILQAIREQGRSLYLYGASTKGNTLLQFYELDSSIIRGAAERNPIKFGRRTPGTNIPIMSEEEVRSVNPDFMLVLPWHFREGFLVREANYLRNGGQFIFPLPHVSIETGQKKALVTGASGQIGTFLVNELKGQGYHVYGTTTQSGHHSSDLLYFSQPGYRDMTAWEDLIASIHPDEIYLLSAETASVTSNAALTTLEVNGNLTCSVLEAVARVARHARVFNASSAELFKGRDGSCQITDSDMLFFPRTPVGIGKLTSYFLIKYYREIEGLQCCSGILTNTESPVKRDVHVTQEICRYLRRIYDHPESKEMLCLGAVDTYRDWIHATDAAKAMMMLLNSHELEDAVIASGESHTIREWVNAAIEQLTWSGHWQESRQGWSLNGIARISTDSVQCRSYEHPTAHITYVPGRLMALGWKPTAFRDIVHDMMNPQNNDMQLCG